MYCNVEDMRINVVAEVIHCYQSCVPIARDVFGTNDHMSVTMLVYFRTHSPRDNRMSWQ